MFTGALSTFKIALSILGPLSLVQIWWICSLKPCLSSDSYPPSCHLRKWPIGCTRPCGFSESGFFFILSSNLKVVSSNQLESQLFLNVTQIKEDNRKALWRRPWGGSSFNPRYFLISYLLLGPEEIRKRKIKSKKGWLKWAVLIGGPPKRKTRI